MDKVQYQTVPNQEIGLIDANYQTFAFQRHYHLDFHIGLITQGEQKFHYQGESHHAGQGQMVLMPPDEMHDGQSKLDSGYKVKVFSLDPQWLSDLSDLKRSSDIIGFNQLVIDDSHVFNTLSQLHQNLTNTNLSQLAQDCLPYEGFSQLFERYGAKEQRSIVPLGNQSVATLKEYLMANLDQPVKLEQLSELC